MRKIELEVSRITQTLTHAQSFVVILKEIKSPNRVLPIIIGPFEAQAINIGKEKTTPLRPFTHDLMYNALLQFDIQVKEVIIEKLVDGVFYANIVCYQHGNVVEVDARPSDAVAIALRFEAPIYTHEFILEAAGLNSISNNPNTTDDDNDKYTEKVATHKHSTEWANFSLEKLNTLLSESLAQENYELAARLRDEIKKREV